MLRFLILGAAFVVGAVVVWVLLSLLAVPPFFQ
jgi:hypothetical protein